MALPPIHTLIREHGIRDRVRACSCCRQRTVWEIEVVRVAAVDGDQALEFIRVCSWCDVQVEHRHH